MSKRVGIIGFLHEANTFNPAPANRAAFTCTVGADIVPAFSQAHHEVGGFLEGLAEAGLQAVPLFVGRATPAGPVPREDFDAMMAMIDQQLDAAGPLDGLLLAPHGAGVSEAYPDMDGHWLSHVRQRVGAAVPIVATIDPHCNLSPKMVAAVDAIIAYRSNPHIDQRPRGVEAARLLARTLAGQARPTMAAAFPPIAIDIERQHTPSEPCRSLYALANDILARPGVLADSVVLGFPYADVAEMGTAFIVVTDNDPQLAQRYADELAAYLHQHRDDFTGRYIAIPQAVDLVRQSARPACLFDMGDNVGGGAPGDYTLLAHALHDAADLRSFVSLVDPAAQVKARAAGVGATVRLTVAGHTDPQFGAPIEADFQVISLHDGKFTEDQPRHGGNTHFDLGPTAIVQSRGLTVQLTTNRKLPASLNQLLHFGLKPEQFDAIVAKGVHAPAAAFEPVCPTMIRVNTPGITCADMRKLTFHHRRKPLFPFESID